MDLGVPHFVVGHLDEDLTVDYFLDGDRETVRRFPAGTTLEVLAVEAGIFPSLTQARKNGMCGEIPYGVRLCGTRRKPFWVWCSPREVPPENPNP